MNILLATEELTAHPNEGLLVFAMHLCRFLSGAGELTVVHADGTPEDDLKALPVLSRKTLLTRKLLRLLRGAAYDLVVYIPSSGLTAFGLGRGLLLRHLSRNPLILIALQERRITPVHGIVSLLGRPEYILSPVESMRRRLAGIGLRTDFIIPGYDERCFRPVASGAKSALRKKYNIPMEKHIVLHVGHIRESRNMQIFLKYREWGHNVLPLIKAGEVDPTWRHRLRMAGVIVIDEYIDVMHELYQLADCYLFPVTNPTGALEFPLSVIEAAACNLPVLSTRFGALPDLITAGDGFSYFQSASEIPALLMRMKETPAATSKKVTSFTWTEVFKKYLEPKMRSLLARRKGVEA
jgi:glycosyltransferase involved in cell wall biosynthesis